MVRYLIDSRLIFLLVETNNTHPIAWSGMWVGLVAPTAHRRVHIHAKVKQIFRASVGIFPQGRDLYIRKCQRDREGEREET